MEIKGNNQSVGLVSYLNRTNEYNQQDSTKTTANTNQSSGADKIELSDQAKEANRAFAELKKLPEIRQEKVGEIKNQVETGTYNIDGNKIAVSMLNESFENNAILNAINLEV